MDTFSLISYRRKKMKFILSLTFVLCQLLLSPVYSATPVDSDYFEGNYNNNCTLSHPNETCQYGNWYLNYIGMNYIYNNDFNLYPDFTVAVLDTAVDLLHEDLDFNIVRDISLDKYSVLRYPHTSWYPNHGNAVIGLFSAGKIGNGLGGRGLVNARTLFLSANSTSDLLDNQGNNFSIGYNANTVLEGIDRLVNPIINSTDGFKAPKIVSLSVGVSPKTELATRGLNYNQGEQFKATQPIRDYIEQNSSILFVMLAHNQGTDAKVANGALHYKYIGIPNDEQEMLDENNYVLQKLPNLIIVASNGPDGVLHTQSNYGESVDITAPSGVYSASCVQNYSQSTYHSVINNQLYGFDYNYYDYSTQRDKIGDSEDDDSFHLSCYENGYFNGNSASQPIVAGAASILLARDETLSPAQIKDYLVDTPNLVKSNLRYNGYYYLTEILAHQIPILNIEKSMKQYEADNTFVEDFENFMNPQVTGDSNFSNFSNFSDNKELLLIRRLSGYIHNSIKYTGHPDIYYSGKNTNLFNSRAIMFYLLFDSSIVFPKKIRSLSFSSLVYGSQNQNEFDIFDQNGNKLGRFTNIPSVIKNHVVNIPVDSEVTGVFFKNVVGANNLLIDNMTYSY